MVWSRAMLIAVLAGACSVAAQQRSTPPATSRSPQAAPPNQQAAQSKPSAPTHAPAAFSVHVIAYLQARNQHAGSMPGPTNDADKLKETRDQIRGRIQKNRAGAKQGEIFDPQVSDYFRKQIAKALHGPNGQRVTASLKRSEPVKKLNLEVNEPYPDGTPLQSMPPTLLMVLPQLPKELEYRIVGRNLVLLDTEANLVIDYLPNAVPQA